MRASSYQAIFRLLLTAAAGTVLVVAIGAIATQIAFSGPKVLTIADAKGGADVALVTIVGTVYPKGENRFLLKDDSGAAEIYTCPPWFRRITLRDGEHVAITGEVLQSPPSLAGAKYRLAAYKIKRANAPDIVLRTSVGKPPWASSKHIPRSP